MLIRVLDVHGAVIAGPMVAVTIGVANVLKGSRDIRLMQPLKTGWVEVQQGF